MRRPSVLFINRVYPPVRGASGRVLRDLARSFAREGWQVTVLTAGARRSNERDGGIKLVRLRGKNKPSNMFGYLWLWVKLTATCLWLPRTDLVVTLSDPPMLVCAGHVLKKFRKNRHIHWCHDLYPDIFPALNVKMPKFMMRFFQKAARKALVSADKVIVVGRCMAERVSRLGVDPGHIAFIPNWPDFELVRPPKPANVNEAAAVDAAGAKPFENQIKDGPKFRVLYAGNIGRAHPVDAILGAAEILDAQNPEIEFAFVGDGPRFDYIARERARRGLHNVRLLPFQPHNRLREVMESGDIHLVSMKQEALGMMVPCKLYSAFAVGRPTILIGPAKSEMGQVLEQFHAGSTVAQDEPGKLAAAIVRYRMDSEAWFAAHAGAVKAGSVFVPKESIEAWVQRAWSVVEPDIKQEEQLKNAA